MKGLLLKDLYMMKKYCRTYILITVVFLAVSVVNSDNMFFVFYPCLICGMIPVTLLGYDERSHWLQYSSTLPYTRKQIVSAKYVTGLCTQAAVLLLTGTVQAVRIKIGGSFELRDFIILMVSILFVSALASSISMPFIFRYGVEKGRIAYYAMIGFVCAFGIIISNVFTRGSALLLRSGILYALFILSAIILYALSWYLSVIFYQKREL